MHCVCYAKSIPYSVNYILGTGMFIIRHCYCHIAMEVNIVHGSLGTISHSSACISVYSGLITSAHSYIINNSIFKTLNYFGDF